MSNTELPASVTKWDWWCDIRQNPEHPAFKAGALACRETDGEPGQAVNPHPEGPNFGQWNLGWTWQLERLDDA